jgi:predicted transcriptional regulator
MPFTSDQLDDFHHFAQVRLRTEPAESLEELVDLWRLEHPTGEEQADTHEAIRQGLADIEAGRYRPVEVVMQEIRSKYGLPSQ